jgi:hypothetical protein
MVEDNTMNVPVTRTNEFASQKETYSVGYEAATAAYFFAPAVPPLMPPFSSPTCERG